MIEEYQNSDDSSSSEEVDESNKVENIPEDVILFKTWILTIVIPILINFDIKVFL